MLAHALSLFLDGPEANSGEDSFTQERLYHNMSLRCNFDGVPIPSVTWLHNDTILEESLPEIYVRNENNVSTLTIQNIGRDAGGLYTCKVNNSDDSVLVNVTTVFILRELII